MTHPRNQSFVIELHATIVIPSAGNHPIRHNQSRTRRYDRGDLAWLQAKRASHLLQFIGARNWSVVVTNERIPATHKETL